MAGNEDYWEKKKRWQKFMYGYNTAMCFSAGPPMILLQDLTKKLLKWPYDDPVMMGIYGSIVTSVGVLSATALKDESPTSCARRRSPPGVCILFSGSSSPTW
jgi:hypothetical protein